MTASEKWQEANALVYILLYSLLPWAAPSERIPDFSLSLHLIMRRNIQLLAAALPLASAWPMVMEEVAKGNDLQKRTVYPTVPPPKFTSGRDNCGFHGPCKTFNAEDQFVDVGQGSGHEWQSPGPSDLRGQCPGKAKV